MSRCQIVVLGVLMPRDDARVWSKKIEAIIKASRVGETEKKVRDDAYHEKVLEKIARGRHTEQNSGSNDSSSTDK